MHKAITEFITSLILNYKAQFCKLYLKDIFKVTLVLFLKMKDCFYGKKSIQQTFFNNFYLRHFYTC